MSAKILKKKILTTNVAMAVSGTNILFAVTGSVAAIKTVDICKEIQKQFNEVTIRICTTKCAMHFIDLFGINELKDEMKIEIYEDDTEWNSWKQRGDPVIHIELRKWADILLISPLSANTLAKISNGICDNLVTSIFRAWEFETKHVIVAPAMNTQMWNNPFTNQQLSKLKKMFRDKFHIIEPISKKLMCGDMGKGAMATPKTIVETTLRILQNEDQNNTIATNNINPTLMTTALLCALLAFAFKSWNRKKTNDDQSKLFDF